MARRFRIYDSLLTLWVVLTVRTLHRQILFYARGSFLKNVAQINIKFPFTTVCFLENRGLTISFYIFYDYTTSGHTEMYSKYVLGIHYIYISIQCTYTHIFLYICIRLKYDWTNGRQEICRLEEELDKDAVCHQFCST